MATWDSRNPNSTEWFASVKLIRKKELYDIFGKYYNFFFKTEFTAISCIGNLWSHIAAYDCILLEGHEIFFSLKDRKQTLFWTSWYTLHNLVMRYWLIIIYSHTHPNNVLSPEVLMLELIDYNQQHV